MSEIDRFIEAQETHYELALKEVKNGKKISCWMWYIFPQIQGLGFSQINKKYSIKDIEEGKLYLENDILKNRLIEITQALLELNDVDIHEVMGIDDVKLKSSMTLFKKVEETYNINCGNIFQKVLDKFFNGEEDNRTIIILEKQKLEKLGINIRQNIQNKEQSKEENTLKKEIDIDIDNKNEDENNNNNKINQEKEKNIDELKMRDNINDNEKEGNNIKIKINNPKVEKKEEEIKKEDTFPDIEKKAEDIKNEEVTFLGQNNNECINDMNYLKEIQEKDQKKENKENKEKEEEKDNKLIIKENKNIISEQKTSDINNKISIVNNNIIKNNNNIQFKNDSNKNDDIEMIIYNKKINDNNNVAEYSFNEKKEKKCCPDCKLF